MSEQSARQERIDQEAEHTAFREAVAERSEPVEASVPLLPAASGGTQEFTARMLDAAKFLALVVSPCGSDGKHSWRECPRCLAEHELEARGEGTWDGKPRQPSKAVTLLRELAEAVPRLLSPSPAPMPINVSEMRERLLMTFGGGYRDKATIEAFRHGMETVCNVLEAHQKGQQTNGILPSPAPTGAEGRKEPSE